MSQPQIIKIPKILKDFFACRIVLAANHQYPEKTQRRFRLQKCLSHKSSISRKYSKTFQHAELSQPQIINIPKKPKDFFACIIVLAASHQYPGKFQRLFRLQNFLSLKSSISRKYSETYWSAELSQPQVICIPKIFEDFLACRIVLAANHQNPGNIQRLIGLLNCLSSKSSKSRKYSKVYWPAELSQPHVICIPKTFEDFFACRIVLAANHKYPGNIQRLSRLQNCLSCKSSVSRNIRRLLRLQKCLNRKSSICRKYSKSFSHAELSQPQIINIPELIKDVFACRNVLATNHQYPEITQRLFSMQNCLSRKSSISRKNPETFSPA